MNRYYEDIQLYPWYLKAPLYALIFLSVAGLSAVISFLVVNRYIRVQVPSIEGRSLPEAVEMLDSMGLSIKVEEEVHDLYVPAGQIIEQGTEAGTLVGSGAEVGIILSKGPEVRLIPDVTGITLREAKIILEEEGLVLDRVIRVHSETVKNDMVIAQRPAPEEWTGETITLVASAGPRDVVYYSPFFTGMAKEDALLLASELELKIALSETNGRESVVGQRPEPGSEIKRGSTVSLTLGKAR